MDSRRTKRRSIVALLLAMVMMATPVWTYGEYGPEETSNFVGYTAASTSPAALMPMSLSQGTLEISTIIIRPGGNATVSVSITNNPGFSSMMLRFEHPPELTLTEWECQIGTAFTGIIPRTGYFYAGWYGIFPNNYTNGVLLTLTFTAGTSAPRNTLLPITAEFASVYGDDPPTNYEGDELDIVIQHGGANVISRIGDTNMDGRVTSADATVLARHLAGHFEHTPGHFTHTAAWRLIADTDCNGRVDIDDLTRLARRLVGHFATMCPYAGCWRCDPSIPPPPPNGNGYEPGDIMQFGGQDWLVLYVCDATNHAKILRDRVIVDQPYHHTWEDITWEHSSSRAWLNGEFFNSFAPAERTRIRETYVVNNDNPWDFAPYGGWTNTPGGNNTIDKIFSLSLDEVVAHFGGSGQLADQNHPNNDWWGFHDQYSNNRIALNEQGLDSWWWLRSPGFKSERAASVLAAGGLFISSNNVLNSSGWGGLRPALWLNLDPTPPPPNGYEPGDIMQFGGQDWLVLYVCDATNHAKILRDRVIVNQPYHHTWEAVTWEHSSSRAWLNGEFFNSFSATDQASIRETYVVNNNNPWTFDIWGWPGDTPGGNNTHDRIFSLSIEEVTQFFGGSELLERGRDESNRNDPISGLYPWGILESNEISDSRIAINEQGSASSWLLRSPGLYPNYAAYVFSGGSLVVSGGFVSYSSDERGLRPALWLNLEF